MQPYEKFHSRTVIVLGLISVLAVAGCGSKESKPSEGDPAPTNKSKSTKSGSELNKKPKPVKAAPDLSKVKPDYSLTAIQAVSKLQKSD